MASHVIIDSALAPIPVAAPAPLGVRVDAPIPLPVTLRRGTVDFKYLYFDFAGNYQDANVQAKLNAFVTSLNADGANGYKLVGFTSTSGFHVAILQRDQV